MITTYRQQIAPNIQVANVIRYRQQLAPATCNRIMWYATVAIYDNHIQVANDIRYRQQLAPATCNIIM